MDEAVAAARKFLQDNGVRVDESFGAVAHRRHLQRDRPRRPRDAFATRSRRWRRTVDRCLFDGESGSFPRDVHASTDGISPAATVGVLTSCQAACWYGDTLAPGRRWQSRPRARLVTAAVCLATMNASTMAPSVSGTETCTSVLIVPACGPAPCETQCARHSRGRLWSGRPPRRSGAPPARMMTADVARRHECQRVRKPRPSQPRFQKPCGSIERPRSLLRTSTQTTSVTIAKPGCSRDQPSVRGAR